MASPAEPTSYSLHNSNPLTPSATKMPSSTQPFAAQLTSEQNTRNPTTRKQRVLLRVKRLRRPPTTPLFTATSETLFADHAKNYFEPDSTQEQSVPVKKRRLSSSSAPEIIRLALPANPSKRHKPTQDEELISRLSSAVSLYDGSDVTTVPGTPKRRTGGKDEEDLLPSSKTPVKPKRSVIFRKLTDLRKLLHEENDDATQHNATDNNDVDGASWDSKGEERSKWLRVVDVKLQESDSSSNECTSEGMGPRLQRMRCRPHENAIDDNNTCRNKRRKLVVEKSCTMSQSEFWTKTNTVECDTPATRTALDSETLQLVQYSLQTLHNQNGGTVSPFLSSLKIDYRLNFKPNTPRAYAMINHRHFNNGQTVLHYAALWGDVDGIRAALEMGADPTIADGSGSTPAAIAERNGHQGVVLALLEAEEAAKNKYYYEVYCLEDGDEDIPPTKIPPNRDGNASPYSSSLTASESEAMDSPPDLIRMDGHGMSEDEDSCVVALMELQNGFGYWNERGELVLEASEENSRMHRSNSATSSVAYACESSGEDASIDYPDEESDDEEVRENHSGVVDLDALGSDYDDYFDADARDMSAYSSDDDSEAGWRLDFRNRFVPGSGAGNRDEDSDDDDELSSGGFGTNRNRLHGWEYSGGMGDGDSDDEEYAGPMLG